MWRLTRKCYASLFGFLLLYFTSPFSTAPLPVAAHPVLASSHLSHFLTHLTCTVPFLLQGLPLALSPLCRAGSPQLSCSWQGRGERYMVKTLSSLDVETKPTSGHSQAPPNVLSRSPADSDACNTTIQVSRTATHYTEVERRPWLGSYSVDQCIRHLKKHGE